jgi:hypothetical protein
MSGSESGAAAASASAGSSNESGLPDWLAKPQGKTLAALAVLLIAIIVVVAAARSSMNSRPRRRRPQATVIGDNTPAVTDTPRDEHKP